MKNIIKFTTFPDGQIHLKNIDIWKNPIVNCRIRNGDDILKLYLFKNLLSQNGFKIEKLKIYWLASLRWDRPINYPHESYDLRVFSDLINKLEIENVEIFDPHSTCALAAINNSIDMKEQLIKFYKHSPLLAKSIIVIPDEGARKRCDIFLENVSENKSSYIQCFKKRIGDKVLIDFKLNNITVSEIKNSNLLIVDDICDGGATFIAIAEALKSLSPKKIDLMVSHGVFSKGLEKLHEYFENLYTTDSYSSRQENHKCVNYFNNFKNEENRNEYFIID